MSRSRLCRVTKCSPTVLQSRAVKRMVLTWTEFSSTEFTCTDALICATLQSRTPLCKLNLVVARAAGRYLVRILAVGLFKLVKTDNSPCSRAHRVVDHKSYLAVVCPSVSGVRPL